MELKELYQEIILDHGKNPRNKGKCDGYTNDAKAHNPLCGDKVHIFLKLMPFHYFIHNCFDTTFVRILAKDIFY